ncbi:MAG TPA: hypothetical protein VIS56_02080 [Candidatus Saccharimonadales bacterium]
MVTELAEHEIFVFGSNIKGEHHGGAARQAFDNFGAVWGVGEGLSGQSYALPTLGENMQRYSHMEMLNIVGAFYRCANAHPELTFLLTPVGTGIAGYPKEYITSLFAALPGNIKKVGW